MNSLINYQVVLTAATTCILTKELVQRQYAPKCILVCLLAYVHMQQGYEIGHCFNKEAFDLHSNLRRI
jgi:hypothetical protein